MDRKLSILGATGSIGRQALEVSAALGAKVLALTANRDSRLLEEQARRFRPQLAVLADGDAAGDLKVRLADTEIRVASGEEGLLEAASLPGADTVLNALVGTAGLKPTLAAVDCGKRVALANKETLVCAGELVMARAREKRAEIIPVDSEHSAIFQCLRAGDPQRELKSLILTGSGGPFWGMTEEELENVTVEQALRHPNWSMGAKITVDSATMMNKGLEFIEAMHLFGAKPEQIHILIHRESVVHSLVEFCDNSVIAQLGVPDMRLPIQFALTYPKRSPSITSRLNLAEYGSLSFFEPDCGVFKCLGLAVETAGRGALSRCVMNAANEAAVALFLGGGIQFLQIYERVSAAVAAFPDDGQPSLDDLLEADRQAREFVGKVN